MAATFDFLSLGQHYAALPDDTQIHFMNQLIGIRNAKGESIGDQVGMLNGSNIIDQFPPFATSITGARAAYLASMESIIKDFPHLSRETVNPGGQLEPIDNEMLLGMTHNIMSATKYVQALQPINVSGAGMADALMASQLSQTNVSQTARSDARAACIELQHMYIALMTLMNRFTLKTSYKMQLRNPLAYPSRHSDTLRAYSAARGIQNADMLLSQSMIMGMYAMPKTIRDNLMSWLYMNPIELQADFQFWDQFTGYATLHSDENGGPAFAIVPNACPNLWLSKCHDSMPYYLTRIPTFLPYDTIYAYDKFVPGETTHDDIAGMYEISQRDELRWGARLMACIASVVSIFASTAKTGKGHSKPSWVHSPINSAVVSATMAEAHRFITEGCPV